jgi:hypothetical protein
MHVRVLHFRVARLIDLGIRCVVFHHAINLILLILVLSTVDDVIDELRCCKCF